MSRSIEFERSETLYLFFSYDQEDLIQEFGRIGLTPKTYEDTPVTRTLYLGATVGMRPGVSIKVRSYSPDWAKNVYHITPDSEFDLLEIKLTTGQATISSSLIDSQDESSDLVFSFQRSLDDALLKRRPRLKRKSRLMKAKNPNFPFEGKNSNKITFKQVIQVLTSSSELDEFLNPKLLNNLNGKVRPLYGKTILPFIVTQYGRIHFVPQEDAGEWKDVVRVTIDPGVEFYNLIQKDPETFVDKPEMIAEFLMKEKHSRLELKIDPTALEQYPKFKNDLKAIFKKYGVMNSISKKWTGLNATTDHYIAQQNLWCERENRYCTFPVHRSWYRFGSPRLIFSKLVNPSENFVPYANDLKVLIKNVHSVDAVTHADQEFHVSLQASRLIFNLPPEIQPYEDNNSKLNVIREKKSIRDIQLYSKKQLEKLTEEFPMDIIGHSYYRSFGGLICSENTNRIYKFSIERKRTMIDRQLKAKFYCKLRYLGSKFRLLQDDEEEIVSDFKTFYDKFNDHFSRPIELYL
ncbi:MAG: hypothetical protein JSW11_20620 [Candidatus Heimdallarchaeota archaeon]|nr:MAG: hypothetical protein JSW11_20620 [Candidatus Heimdallarchaeota archaeon]